MTLRQRLLSGTDRMLAIVLATLLAGTTLAFGGGVWWAPAAIAGLTGLFLLGWLLHLALDGRVRILKSPLTALGVVALGLGVLQLAPLPAPLAARISLRSHEAYSLGFFPDRVRGTVPGIELPEPAPVRTPVSVDRSATVRWIAGAAVCLGLFWGVSQFTDRLRRLYIVWGSLIAAFFFNTAIAVVQLVGHNGALYGLYEPGRGPFWAPSVNDLLTTPNTTVLREIAGPVQGHPVWATLVPDRPFLMGTMMGGPGAFLALGAIGLPLALALLLQLLSPRGSRERLAARLGESGQGGLVVLLAFLLVTAAVLVGYLAGPLSCLPFAVAMLLVGLPNAWQSSLRWSAIGLTALALGGLGGGLVVRDLMERLPGASPPVSAESLVKASRVWSDSLAIVREFPILGTGMGSFSSIYPFYKSRDEGHTTAQSTLLQWWVESGTVGLVLLAIAACWCLWRLPGAVRRVGTADRSLVFGLIGAAVGFSLYAAVHWTVELTAVAIAASALGGTCNRWLAGGTDLFVERG